MKFHSRRARARHSARFISCSACANLKLASDIAIEDDEELTAEEALPIRVRGGNCSALGPVTTARAGVLCSTLGLLSSGLPMVPLDMVASPTDESSGSGVYPVLSMVHVQG